MRPRITTEVLDYERPTERQLPTTADLMLCEDDEPTLRFIRVDNNSKLQILDTGDPNVYLMVRK